MAKPKASLSSSRLSLKPCPNCQAIVRTDRMKKHIRKVHGEAAVLKYEIAKIEHNPIECGSKDNKQPGKKSVNLSKCPDCGFVVSKHRMKVHIEKCVDAFKRINKPSRNRGQVSTKKISLPNDSPPTYSVDGHIKGECTDCKKWVCARRINGRVYVYDIDVYGASTVRHECDTSQRPLDILRIAFSGGAFESNRRKH